MKRYLFLFFLFYSVVLFAQDNDFGVYPGLKLSKELNKRFAFKSEFELRTHQNSKRIDRVNIDAGLRYKIAKGLSIDAYLRFSKDEKYPSYYENGFKYYSSLAYKYEIQNFTIRYRLRYTSQYRSMLTSVDGKIPNNYIRNRVGLVYSFPFSKFNLFTYYENYLRLKPADIYASKSRFEIGVEYKINKKYSIELFEIYQKPINNYNPVNNFGTGVIFKMKY